MCVGCRWILLVGLVVEVVVLEWLAGYWTYNLGIHRVYGFWVWVWMRRVAIFVLGGGSLGMGLSGSRRGVLSDGW